MNVSDWLRSLGFEQYAAAFRENEIDGEILPTLTAEDLKELGVGILGHRRKMLTAIAALSSSSALPASVARPPPAQSAAPSSAEDGAERRQLTVMFCDLVGSTALSARLDPEDMREVIRAYQDVCSGMVARYDGFVAKFMGDGILAYFGYPRAHEDDAERAVRAGLDIGVAVEKLETPAKGRLLVRIGIATGVVVVGDVVGQGSAQEQAVVGDTPNLAARLQAGAEPGSVVVAEATRRLLGGAFVLQALGPRTLKGFAEPAPVWRVLRETENVSRFEASRSEEMTPLVGREHEVALLLDRWRDATEGEGQVVLMSGEAGIGKSRILAALRERIGDERYIAMRYQCSPHHSNDAFYPIVAQIWRAAGFTQGEPAATRLDKLEAMVAASGLDPDENVPCLASLLSIPTVGRYFALELAPSELKERTVASLLALFAGLANGAPVLALLEDAHWIDPTSLDLFDRLVEGFQGLRALLVVTHRPEFVAPWIGRRHVTAHALNRFGRRQAAAMVDRVARGKALPAQVLDEIVAKTDGVPLFVEELTKTVLESGLLREENGVYILAAALTPLAISSTLQDLLMERLDRLAPVKEIAQIGAAIGREFSYRLLEEVSSIKGPALQDALRRLSGAELIYGRGAPPEATYVFKHALVQDTAYASLLRSARQRIHADIARALVERFADHADSAPATIAHHYDEAGLAEPAARYWLAAAELALSRSAHSEADRYVEAGLTLMSRLKEGPDRQALDLALSLARANALTQLKGYTASETVAALAMTKRLLDAGAGSDLQRFSVLFGLCAADFFAARTEPALDLARQMVAVADRQDDLLYRLVAYRLLGTTQVTNSRYHEALETLEKAGSYRDRDRQNLHAYRFGYDPGLAALYYKIWALLFLGLPDRAMRAKEQVLAELPSHKYAPTVAGGIFYALMWPELLFGDLETCERHGAELAIYCASNRAWQWRLLGAAVHACASAGREPTKENIAAVRAAIEAEHLSGGRFMDSVFFFHLAEALLATGDISGAEATLGESFAFVEESGERFWLAELHRLDGRIALRRPEPDMACAEACFLQAIEIARGQQARLLELRAATDLARLWRDVGSSRDFRALLELSLAAIEGGGTMRDVLDARALLAEIA